MEEKRNLSPSTTSSSGSDTVNSKKPLVRTNFILSVLLFTSVLGLLYFYSQAQSYKQQLLRITKIPTPTPQYIYVDKPTPTVLTENKISSARQTINLLVPKYLDSPQDKETYDISFDKVSPDTTYAITKDVFPKLIISDGTYEFSVQIPKEGQSNTFKKVPDTEMIRTNQFNSVTRVSYPENSSESKSTVYYYVTDFNTNCTQWQPRPAACTMLQVYWNDKTHLAKQIGAYIKCKSNAFVGQCDKLIASLSIDFK